MTENDQSAGRCYSSTSLIMLLMHFIHDNPVIFMAIYTCSLNNLSVCHHVLLHLGAHLEIIMQDRLVIRSRFY